MPVDLESTLTLLDHKLARMEAESSRKSAFMAATDPSLGGQPPQDPSAGGGMPPGMDPSMGGGMPPGGDLAAMMGGGMPPGMGGGMDPGSLQAILMPMIQQAIQQAMGGAGGAPGAAGGKGVDIKNLVPQILQKVQRLELMIAQFLDSQGIPVPATAMIAAEGDPMNPGAMPGGQPGPGVQQLQQAQQPGGGGQMGQAMIPPMGGIPPASGGGAQKSGSLYENREQRTINMVDTLLSQHRHRQGKAG